jgi:hypothetical protein
VVVRSDHYYQHRHRRLLKLEDFPFHQGFLEALQFLLNPGLVPHHHQNLVGLKVLVWQLSD